MKKFLSIIFALAIILTMLPVQSFSANTGFTYAPPEESFLKSLPKTKAEKLFIHKISIYSMQKYGIIYVGIFQRGGVL